ncbi:MAG: aminoglycoside phosphotransferase family protein [Bacteroidales bacterium]
MTLAEIAGQFQTSGPIVRIPEHGSGHINDSYRLVNGSVCQPDYLLQRVNHYVFKDVPLLMRNMELVTRHIRSVLMEQDTTDYERKSLEIIPTVSGDSFFNDPDGNFWRVINYIPEHLVFERASDPSLAYEGALQFGGFTRMLDGLSPEGLGDTIPNFHNMRYRLDNLAVAIREDRAGRVRLVPDELAYVREVADLMCTIQDLGDKGTIPRRVTHNDTKISNVLFDLDRKGLCVIDLDTVMPGYVHYDFGDGIRTFTNTGEEDDEDLGNISMNLDMYREFARGFLEATRDILQPAEADSLVYAGLLFPFIMAVRFLTDYLAGDVYYKIKHPDHNLIRARAQFHLAQDGQARLEDCKKIIRDLLPRATK